MYGEAAMIKGLSFLLWGTQGFNRYIFFYSFASYIFEYFIPYDDPDWVQLVVCLFDLAGTLCLLSQESPWPWLNGSLPAVKHSPHPARAPGLVAIPCPIAKVLCECNI